LLRGITPADVASPGIITFRRGSWAQQFKLGLQLRRNRYRRIYDLQGNDRSRALTWLSGAGTRIGLWPGWPYNLTAALPRTQRCHPFQRINALLAAAGFATAAGELALVPAAPEQQQVEQWLHEHALDPGECPLVLIHPGCNARWPSKRWPEPAFAELAQNLTAAGLTVIWIGGPDERTLTTRLSARCGIDASSVFSINALIALAGRARFAITNDSAPMHALAAASIPIYSFFGPTDWRLSHAVGQAGRVLSAPVDCSPCFARQCPLTQNIHRCMTAISPQQVLQRLDQDGLLSNR
jgi:ADP-heptose:LPS heptosyltransferase